MATNRIAYVARSASAFAAMMLNNLTIEELEAFANHAEVTAHEKSREMTEALGDDEMALTSHAAHMRSLAAKIVLLRDGLVPALKIDKDNSSLRNDAVRAMGYIRAEFEAMTFFVR
ncbi:hypothetical protein A3D62_01540 [Candidatus Kaiserbacteria bacterium RIFCSPHIGHO2_02_FULL_49_11]|uniref:Uncharacterized protein n=1 Tax=Candidatus Kaiserbacteria bacterium RIFCSPHIGHO2_02_FULL_49_11 TaxID=1798489 RepID=A0A1F6D1D4_9BACT|nr:MAG: hypothetical protein A3D62_01540 [Candidatus Kaiserbacteria bacterium RIFCSPHIGHO2_02_FULL_49_11]